MFLIAVGLRYKGYCANLGRSIIVDPSKVSVGYASLVAVLDSITGTRRDLQALGLPTIRGRARNEGRKDAAGYVPICGGIYSGEEARSGEKLCQEPGLRGASILFGVVQHW